jgi:hypothetical protein
MSHEDAGSPELSAGPNPSRGGIFPPLTLVATPIDPAADRPTVAVQDKDAGSLLNHIRHLAALRREHPALGADGGFDPLYAEKKIPLHLPP